jgi:hypothetical protein
MKAAILQYGPMAECHLATTVKVRKADASAELERHPHLFVHNGLKARASRWDLRGFTAEELALRWGLESAEINTIVFGADGFLERGFVESVDGNGRIRVTELGRQASEAWIDLGFGVA